MNLNYLECFVSLSETLSFTETAKNFSVSQPSISRQIRLLEEQLNHKLFIRDKHKVYLTEAGIQLKNRLRPLIKEIKNVMESTTENSDNLTGSISFGCLTEVGQYSFMNMLMDFQKSNSNVDLDIQFISPHDIVEKIKMGQLDFGVIGQPIELENVRTYQLMEERAVLVTRTKNNKPMADIHVAKFVTYLNYDVLLVSYLQKYYKKISYAKIHKAVSVNSHRSMKDALYSGDYYAVLPYFSVERAIEEGKLKIVSKNELKNHIYLIYLENHLMPMKNEAFRKYLIQACKVKSL